jgi:60 kDa SS-A/Ro ribonucleoprotein
LRDPKAIGAARAMPYQLLMAFLSVTEDVPRVVQEALEDAMEIATENVPSIDGRVWVCPDVSGSMSSPLTGVRKGATSKARCIDIAALIAAAIVRKNSQAEVIPFEHRIRGVKLNARDTVMTNAAKLAAIGGGGTSCSAPLAELNRRKAKGDLVLFVSDNESWADPSKGRGTEMMEEWATFKDRNPDAKLVCLDLQPGATTQAPNSYDVLNVGGFSDAVFEVVSAFVKKGGQDAWVRTIEAIDV